MAGRKNNRKKPIVESESEDEVLDLGINEEEDSDQEDTEDVQDSGDENDISDEEEEDDDDGNEEEEEDDEEESDSELNNLVKNLPFEMRQKILSGHAIDEDLSDDDSEIDAKVTGKWGKKKEYYSGDTADLEIGQSFDDAEEELEAVKELHSTKLAKMKESDYQDDLEDSEDDDTFKSTKSMLSKDKVMGDLEKIALSGQQSEIETENIEREGSNLSKKKKQALIESESPELQNILIDFKEKLVELRTKINPIKTLVDEAIAESDGKNISDELVEYLMVKQQMLMSYCTNVAFYLYLKVQGVSVRQHPVMKQLLQLRYAMEKLRAVDSKLKHQVDRLVQLSSMSAEEAKKSLLKPNLGQLMSDDDEEEDDNEEGSDVNVDDMESDDNAADFDSDDEDNGNNNMDDESSIEDDLDGEEDSDEEDMTSKKKPLEKVKSLPKVSDNQVYRAPKMMSMPYESEKDHDKQQDKLKRKMKKLKNSEILESLRGEFGVTPELASSTGMSVDSESQRALKDLEDERRQHEEDRFLRTTLSRKEKQELKRRRAAANQLEDLHTLGDLGDYEDLEEVMKLSQVVDSTGSTKKKKGKKMSMDDEDNTNNEDYLGASSAHRSSQALQKAVNAFAKIDKKALAPKDSDDSMPAYPDKWTLKPKKVSTAMDDDVDGQDEEFDQFEDNAPKGKKRRAAPMGSWKNDDIEEANDDAGDNLISAFADKKRKFLEKKQQHYTAEPRYGGWEAEVGENEKRGINYEIKKNRGLTPHRKKENNNGRVKKRNQFDKAVKRRKGQVMDVRSGVGSYYGGEDTGVKVNVSKSRRFGDN